MWVSTLTQARYVVLYDREIFTHSLLHGYIFNVIQDAEDEDTIYLVSSKKVDSKYAKIEGFDDKYTGVYRILKFDQRLMSFSLKRVLPLPGYSQLTRNGIQVRKKVLVEEYDNNGFSFVFLKRPKTRTKRAFYVARVAEKRPGVTLYRRLDDDTIAIIRITDTVFFRKPEFLHWDKWLLLCESDEICEGFFLNNF